MDLDDARLADAIAGTLRTEGAAVSALAEQIARLPDAALRACRCIHERCGLGQPGRLVVTGVGKAGLVGRKVSATFASTGTASFVLHPTEARHGDLGMVQEDDAVLALSHSGRSEEVVDLIPSLKRIGVPVIALVGRADSPLARLADVAVVLGEVVEACPLGLAPSTSTTCLLALGDALALAVQRLNRFTPEQYARFHPGGALGRKLMTCREAMRPLDRLARVAPATPVAEALRAITNARTGSALLVDPAGVLLGIFTDGNLRRALQSADDAGALLRAPVRDHAALPGIRVRDDALLSEALGICSARRIDELPVVDADGRLVGLLDTQDLVHRGFEVGA